MAIQKYKALGEMIERSLIGGGAWVTFEDHLASHAFDETKERARFENFAVDRRSGYGNLPFFIFARKETGEYVDGTAELAWEGWLACAKSRAEQ